MNKFTNDSRVRKAEHRLKKGWCRPYYTFFSMHCKGRIKFFLRGKT